MRPKYLVPLALTLSIVVICAWSGGTAQGDSQSGCFVTDIGWSNDEGGLLELKCGSELYKAHGPGTSGCPAVSMEARKAWFSLVQGARLSVRSLSLDYTSCGGHRGLTRVRVF